MAICPIIVDGYALFGGTDAMPGAWVPGCRGVKGASAPYIGGFK